MRENKDMRSPFERKYGDAKPIILPTKSDKKYIIFLAIAALFSFFCGSWQFGLISAGLCVAYVFTYRKHKKREDEAEAFLEKFIDEEDDGTTRLQEFGKLVKQSRENDKKSRKERKQEYNDYLKKIEADFDTSNIDSDVEDEDDWFDDEEDDGYKF